MRFLQQFCARERDGFVNQGDTPPQDFGDGAAVFGTNQPSAMERLTSLFEGSVKARCKDQPLFDESSVQDELFIRRKLEKKANKKIKQAVWGRTS